MCFDRWTNEYDNAIVGDRWTNEYDNAIVGTWICEGDLNLEGAYMLVERDR